MTNFGKVSDMPYRYIFDEFNRVAAEELLSYDSLIEGAPFNASFKERYNSYYGEADNQALTSSGSGSGSATDSDNQGSASASSDRETRYDELTGEPLPSAYVAADEDDRGYRYVGVSEVEVSDMIETSKSTYYGYFATELNEEGSPKLESSWQVKNNGEEHYILATLEETTDLKCIVLRNGRAYPEEKYEQNCRIRDCYIEVFNSEGECLYSEELTLFDQNSYQYIICDNMKDVKYVALNISSVYDGSKYNDICLTYMGFYTID